MEGHPLIELEWAAPGVSPGRGSSQGVQRLRIDEEVSLSAMLGSYPAVTALDPGGESGLTTVWYDPAAMMDTAWPLQRSLRAWQSAVVRGTENYQVLQIIRWLKARSVAPHNLVIEDFILQSFLPGREVLSPVRITAAVEYQCWRGFLGKGGKKKTYEVHRQSPSDALSTITDERLKLHAMYTPGPDHARDSSRHALLYLRKVRQELLRRESAR